MAQDRYTIMNIILTKCTRMTGSGKTTFISKLTGKNLKIGHNLESCKFANRS